MRLGPVNLTLKKARQPRSDRTPDGRFVPSNTTGRTGGRKKKSVELARMEAKIAELNLRTRYQLAKARAAAVRRGAVGAAEETHDLDIDHLTVAQAKKLGVRLTFGPKNQPIEETGIVGFIKGFLSEDTGKAVAGMLGAQLMGGGAPRAEAPAPSGPARPRPPAALPPSAPVPAPPAAAAPGPAAPAPEAAPVEGGRAGLIVGALDGLDPAEAAARIVQYAPLFGVGWLVDALVRTPDQGREPFLAAIAEQQPEAAPLVAWLRARPEWTAATVTAMRERVGVNGAAPHPAAT